MKKNFLIFLACFAIGFATFFLAQYYHPRHRGQTVHVFFEVYATNPAFGQMIEFARLPKSTPKIIAWHRFPDRKNALDLKEYNAQEIDIVHQEGYNLTSTYKVLDKVMQIYAHNPDTRFVFYVNLTHQNKVLVPFLKRLPKKNIAHIHLYEDGYSDFLKRAPVYYNDNKPYQTPDTERIQAAYDGKIPWETVFNISIHKFYPATYHLMHVDKLQSEPKLKALRDWLKNAPVEPIDFEKLSKSMTKAQKQTVYKLAGFDYDKFYKLMHAKPTLVYTFGYMFGNKHLGQAQLNLLTSLRTGELSFLTQNTPYRWFYKFHPSLSAKNEVNTLHKLFPDMVEIPAQVPFEVLILAGLKPTKTVGYGSSLFYALKPGDVLSYVKRMGKDNYLPFLIKYNIVHLDQIIDLKKFTDDALDCNTRP